MTPTGTTPYADIQPITTYIEPQKQATKRHYGSHQYFTKRAWNVIAQYIARFSKPEDVVCDPYGGSGVTSIEAMVLGRRAIYLDISEWAKFLAEQVAVAPVNLAELSAAFEQVEKRCAKQISRWHALSDENLAEVPITRWYPRGYPLPRNADVPFVEDLFTHRQLLCLSELRHHIQDVQSEVHRNLLRYAFSATLYMCNRTFLSAKGRKESRGGSSIFSIYRYKVAKRTVELNPWTIFAMRFRRLMACKRETNQLLGPMPSEIRNARFIKGYAQKLTEYVTPESVDYIFTDPPYGAHISYLDLTRMWDAWLGFKLTPVDLDEETIEGGDARHTPEHFKERLSDGIAEMFKVLKYDRWMSLVFSHREVAMWDVVVKASERAGFEYVNTVAQPLNVVWSMHKKKNPLTVLSGELIINFRKVRNPKTLAITRIGSDAVNLIKDSAELTIVQNAGASTDQIYADLIPKLLEHGLLGEVSGKISDLTPILSQEFIYDSGNETWHTKPGRKLGSHIPLEQRIRFYVRDYLNQCVRLGKNATIDEIVMTVLPKLKNGPQPTEQKILEEVRKIASPYLGKFWVVRHDPQHTFDFALSPLTGRPLAVEIKPEDAYEHNELLYMLASLGGSAGFECHVGKKEQVARWESTLLADLSTKELPFLHGAAKFTESAVSQIDLIWMESKVPLFAFEIEHSTPMTTAIDRFIELLKVAPMASERLVIIAPKSRRRKLNEVLSSHSHYIGAPMYMEAKIRYLWYSDLIRIARRFSEQQPNKSNLVQAILGVLHAPTVLR